MRNPDLASPSNILSVSKSITLLITAITTITTPKAAIILMINGNGEHRDLQYETAADEGNLWFVAHSEGAQVGRQSQIAGASVPDLFCWRGCPIAPELVDRRPFATWQG